MPIFSSGMEHPYFQRYPSLKFQDWLNTATGRDVIWFHSQVTGDFSAAGGNNQCLPLKTALQQLSNSETDSITSTPPWNNNVYPSVSLWTSLPCQFITHQPTVQGCLYVQCAWRQFAGYYWGITTVCILYGDKPWTRCPHYTVESVTALLAVF